MHRKEIKMENKQILEAARRNTARGREFESRESIRSSLLGAICSTVLGTVLFLLNYFVGGKVSLELIAVAMTYAAAQLLYEGIRVKKPLFIVLGAIEAAIALLSVVFFIYFLLV